MAKYVGKTSVHSDDLDERAKTKASQTNFPEVSTLAKHVFA